MQLQGVRRRDRRFRVLVYLSSLWMVTTRPLSVAAVWSPWSAVETAFTIPAIRTLFGLENVLPADAEPHDFIHQQEHPSNAVEKGSNTVTADEESIFSNNEKDALPRMEDDDEDANSEATARAGYGYGASSVGAPSLFGFDSVVFGLALAAFGAFLIQFIVNLVNGAGRRKKRSLDGQEEKEHVLDMFTRWILPVVHGDYQTIWNDLDPNKGGIWNLIYENFPSMTDFSDTNEMLTQFAAMGEAMKSGHDENEALFPDNGGVLAKDVHKKLCDKYSLMNTDDRINARISKYYWFALTYSGYWKWVEPYLKSIGHGIDGQDCDEWPEDGTKDSEGKLENSYGSPGEVSRSVSSSNEPLQ